jgi:hypothetical protein
VERVTTLFSHMVRLDGSQVIPLNKSVALVGVDGWADGLGGEGPATKARINDFYQILDFATEQEAQVFREMKKRARKYSQALKPSLSKTLRQYETTIIATHVPPYEGAAWHEGSPSSPDYQPFFSSPVLRLRKMRSGQRFSYLALDPEETPAINAAYHRHVRKFRECA